MDPFENDPLVFELGSPYAKAVVRNVSFPWIRFPAIKKRGRRFNPDTKRQKRRKKDWLAFLEKAKKEQPEDRWDNFCV